MRVTGGNARGRQIKAPKGDSVRPTASRVRQALFNILGQDLSGRSVLDLFAGTGNLTIEALSRGAARAVLVDSSEKSAALIRNNLQTLGLFDSCSLLVMPVSRAVRILGERGERFDLVFLDPPYHRRHLGVTLELLGAADIYRPTSTIVVEHSVREPIGPRLQGLLLKDQRRYGDTLLSFLVPAAKSSASNEGHAQDAT